MCASVTVSLPVVRSREYCDALPSMSYFITDTTVHHTHSSKQLLTEIVSAAEIVSDVGTKL